MDILVIEYPYKEVANMKVILRAVNYDTIEEMKRTLGSNCFKSNRAAYHDCDELRDVTLSEAVILKTHDSEITLDLGGKLFTIEEHGFESVIVR